MSQDKEEVTVLPKNQFLLENVPIGRGGYGTVYRAQHTKLGLVAIKTLIETGLLPQKHLMALQREAERLRGVCQHPSILNLHGIITEKDNYSLVLEYMPLGSATDFRKDFNVQWPLMVQIIRDVIDGMTFLHEHNPTILHLDLKGDNILLDNLCRAKLSDFGLSEWKTITMTVTRGGGGGGGQSSARQCTVSHVPPEVWTNVNLPSDKFYDIYSFGIVIWELLSGQYPYKMASEELIRSAVLSGQRPDFIQIPNDCPMFLTRMMMKCWHQKPAQRPHFRALKPEINEEFEKNYKKHIVKSLKSVRQQIRQMYPSTDPVYFCTNEIDTMEEPVEPEEPVPSTSSGSQTSAKVVDEAPPGETQQEPPKEERKFPKVLFKPKEDLNVEDKEVRKVLFSPTACRLLKTKYFREIFKITEDTRQILMNPEKRKEYIESDDMLARQVRYSKCNGLRELEGEYYDFRQAVGHQATNIAKREMYDIQSKSYKKSTYWNSYSNDEKSERGLKHQRAVESLDKNPEMKRLKTEGNYYKVKKIIESPEVLKQALEDRKKGVSSAQRLVAIDPKDLDLLKDPFLLLMVFDGEYEIRNKYVDHPEYRKLYMQLFADARYTKSEFPSGGFKFPKDMCDMIPSWLEAAMVKEGFNIDRLPQMQDAERRRSKYSYGMYPDMDDDDFYEYGPMRHLSRRMMDVNVKPGSKLSEKLTGYDLRRIVENVEKKANKTDLAKQIIRILSRVPPEEREEIKKQNKERKGSGMRMGSHPMSHMRGEDPIEMMMMMGMDPSRMDERMFMKAMKMDQMRRKEMRSMPSTSEGVRPLHLHQSLLKRKASSSSTSPSTPSPSTSASKTDVETDAAGSMDVDNKDSKSQTNPSDPKKSKPEVKKTLNSKSQTNPSDPKKSKPEELSKKSKAESEPSASKAKDGTIEIEHKSKGMLGGITKLFFGKSAKVPNMQIGEHNLMRIGHPYDDSDEDDDMPGSSYDKKYQPPTNARPPTKSELDNICSRIQGDYRNLGRQLKVPYNTVEQIVEDFRKEGNPEVTYQIIRKWQELKGEEANNIALSDTLHKMRRDDLSKFLRF